MGNIYTLCFLPEDDKNNTNEIITPSFIINYNTLGKKIDTSTPYIIENYYKDNTI